MYESFYGFTEKPFSLTPDPEFLYLSKKHGMALTALEYGLTDPGGISVVTGEVGSGKTTLVRHLLSLLDDSITVGLITSTPPSDSELLKWVLLAFDLDFDSKDRVGLYGTFVDFMIEQYAQNRRTLLIVDEAQNLSVQTLEELRMLSNVNADKHQVLQIQLVGQPELLQKLNSPELRQFAQRITAHNHLDPLGFAETAEYIRHRLQVAEGDPGTFDDMACGAIHHFTGGTPRLINTLCETALVYGFAEDKTKIDLSMILEVVKDKRKSGLNLFTPKGLAEKTS